MNYQITKELLQNIVNILQELPAKNVYGLLTDISKLVAEQNALQGVEQSNGPSNTAVQKEHKQPTKKEKPPILERVSVQQ